MNEAEEPTPETSTSDADSTRDETLGKLMLWTAVGIGILAAGKAIFNAAVAREREAHLEHVVRSGWEARRWGLPAGPSPSRYTGRVLPDDPKPSKRDELERGWIEDDNPPGDKTAAGRY
jgi:hypothetical protein